MRSTRIAALAALALPLAACDPAAPPQAAAVVSGLTVSELPLRRPNGRAWDRDGTGPDLVVEVQDIAGRAYYRGPSVADFAAEHLPWGLPGTFEVAAAERDLFVVLMDYDEADAGEGTAPDIVGVSDAFRPMALAAGPATVTGAGVRVAFEVAP
jgi:hypothetical protein